MKITRHPKLAKAVRYSFELPDDNPTGAVYIIRIKGGGDIINFTCRDVSGDITSGLDSNKTYGFYALAICEDMESKKRNCEEIMTGQNFPNIQQYLINFFFRFHTARRFNDSSTPRKSNVDQI